MNILASLPDTHAGRQTKWLWSRMLAIAGGSPPPGGVELAEHFAPSVFEELSTEQLAALFTQTAPLMSQVTGLLEEASSEQHYSALLRLPDSWLRYTCQTQAEAPHRILAFAYPPALDPNSYVDRRVHHAGRDVQIRDFGGAGPLLLLWHGAGGDRSLWEALVPHLAGFHVVAQDLPGHGGSQLKMFTLSEALMDADAVVAKLDEGLPIVVGHSLGGYLGLRYAATRRCAGFVGLDGPFGLAYPWNSDDPGLPESTRQVAREIRTVDVVGDLAAATCPLLLMLCAIAASQTEEILIPSRRELAEHVARRHPLIRVEWVQTGHDTILFHQPQETAAGIRDFLRSSGGLAQLRPS